MWAKVSGWQGNGLEICGCMETGFNGESKSLLHGSKRAHPAEHRRADESTNRSVGVVASSEQFGGPQRAVISSVRQ